MKCNKCGNEMRIGTEQVGVDNRNLPIIHRFAYCDTCREKTDLDLQQQPSAPPKPPKKKDSGLSLVAVILSFFTCTFWIGFIVAIIDLCTDKHKNKKHTGSIFAIVLSCIWLCVSLFGGNNSENTTQTTTKSETKNENIVLNIKLVEDENVAIYLDHIEKGKLYVKYCNNSEEDYNMSFKKLEINEDFYVSGIFVDTIYAGRERVIKLDLYTEDGEKASDYYYESGTIKGVFTYYPDGVGFITELDFEETEFNK